MTADKARVLRARRPGQGLVELALAMPLLLLLLLGVVEFARAWNLHQVITDASREGARTAVVDNGVAGTDSVESIIEGAIARAGFDPATAVITITGIGAGTGTPTMVLVEYPHRLRIIQGLMNWATADATFTLRASSTMRNE
jgi:Flp pilus assembly protein TadG